MDQQHHISHLDLAEEEILTRTVSDETLESEGGMEWGVHSYPRTNLLLTVDFACC